MTLLGFFIGLDFGLVFEPSETLFCCGLDFNIIVNELGSMLIILIGSIAIGRFSL